MVKSLFATTSNVKEGSGGGIVSYNIALALKEATDLQLILCYGETNLAPCRNINPTSYGLPNQIFLCDYIASQYVFPVDIAHFRGDPFGITAEKIRLINPSVKIIVDLPAHNLEESIREFEIWKQKYPFIHMVDETLWKFYAKHIRISDMIICPSQYSADYVATSKTFNKIFLHRPIIKVIPHGTSIPNHVVELPEKFTVTHLGINGFDKGQIYLVLAWKKLVEEGIKNAKLLIGGEGTNCWNNAVQYATGLGNIEDIDEFYNLSSVYCQPSVTEGFGIPVIEAMAHGRPVIVTEGVGAKDLVIDGKNGFIVPIRNPDAIAEKIRYFYDNPDEIKRFGKNARETAKEYTWEKIRDKYKEVYQQLLSEGRNGLDGGGG